MKDKPLVVATVSELANFRGMLEVWLKATRYDLRAATRKGDARDIEFHLHLIAEYEHRIAHIAELTAAWSRVVAESGR